MNEARGPSASDVETSFTAAVIETVRASPVVQRLTLRASGAGEQVRSPDWGTTCRMAQPKDKFWINTLILPQGVDPQFDGTRETQKSAIRNVASWSFGGEICVACFAGQDFLSSAVETPGFSAAGLPVRSLIWELRSHMPHGQTSQQSKQRPICGKISSAFYVGVGLCLCF